MKPVEPAARALAEEVAVSDPSRTWREDGDVRLGVIVTVAGRAVIAAEETEESSIEDTALHVEQDGVADAGTAPVVAPPAPTTKIAMVLALLQQEHGATLDELTDATGWLPHTTRAALTGLRKKGHEVVRDTRDGATCYRIAEAA